jgi:hypothetical protein
MIGTRVPKEDSMRRISLFLAALLFVQYVAVAAAPAPGPHAAQISPQQPAQVEKVKAEVRKRGIGEKARVRVTLHDRSQQKGYISRFEDTSFAIKDKKSGRENTIPYADVERIQNAGLSIGVKIGIAVGVGVVVAAVVLAVVVCRSGFCR